MSRVLGKDDKRVPQLVKKEKAKVYCLGCRFCQVRDTSKQVPGADKVYECTHADNTVLVDTPLHRKRVHKTCEECNPNNACILFTAGRR
jgi:hypothetical protein